MAKITEEERAESMTALRESLKPGDTVHTVLRHVSRDGMSRRLDVYKFSVNKRKGAFAPNGVSKDYLTWHAARVLGLRLRNDDNGLTVGGAGMDMGFHVVYELSARLFSKDGYECIGDACPSNAHTNGAKRRKGVKHFDGYALRHEWI